MSPSTVPSDPAILVSGRKPHDDEVDLFGATHQGLVRKSNQDHYLVTMLHKTMRVHSTSLPNPEILEIPSQRLASVMMVADGVGGSRAGGEASRSALEAVASYVTQTMQCYFASDPQRAVAFTTALQEAADACHESVLERGRQHPEFAGMATTLTLSIVTWPKLYILHVGDSRCYMLRQGELIQLTRDQTMAQYLVDTGALPADRIKRSPFANVLASAIGGTTQPEVGEHTMIEGDVLLLCSDGLTKHVSDDRIKARLMVMESSEQVSRALIQDALDDGGSDNVTVVVGRAVLRS